MILTEEQRAAIHAVSGLLTAIGCPQCHSYLQKNYTHHIEVLRAMTDSSEHFSDATKMIGFDMEKARASIAHYRIENPSNVDTESALKELVDQANLAEDALAEIERLQVALLKSDNSNKIRRGITEGQDGLIVELDDKIRRQDTRIKGLEGEIERLRAALDESEKVVAHKTKSAAHWYDEHLQARADRVQTRRVVEQQAARIKELESLVESSMSLVGCHQRVIEKREKALVEERARYIDDFIHEFDPQEDRLDEAREQLRAEGKIGPDAEAAHRECQEC